MRAVGAIEMTEPDNKNLRTDGMQDSDDWESAALRRVAPHVEALPEFPAEAEDFGWEESVLQNLRKRIAAND